MIIAQAPVTRGLSLRFAWHSVVALGLAMGLSACNGCPKRAESPTFTRLDVPDPGGANTWTNAATSGTTPTAAVLPTRGRGARVLFALPVGRSFNVSLKDPATSAVTVLPLNTGAPAAPADGYFQIVNVDVSGSTPVYTMYVRSPAVLADPLNYDVEIVNVSQKTDEQDSIPLVVQLRKAPVYRVSIIISGPGHVTSTPPGISCGERSLGPPLTDCSFVFGPGPVRLDPHTVDTATQRFRGWEGACPSNTQTCTLALDGTAEMVARAKFETGTSAFVPSPCPAAPPIANERWIEMPQCTPTVGASTPALCDSAGYFCCESSSGSSAPRCAFGGGPGTGQREFPPNCAHKAPRGIPHPFGCYESTVAP